MAASTRAVPDTRGSPTPDEGAGGEITARPGSSTVPFRLNPEPRDPFCAAGSGGGSSGAGRRGASSAARRRVPGSTRRMGSIRGSGRGAGRPSVVIRVAFSPPLPVSRLAGPGSSEFDDPVVLEDEFCWSSCPKLVLVSEGSDSVWSPFLRREFLGIWADPRFCSDATSGSGGPESTSRGEFGEPSGGSGVGGRSGVGPGVSGVASVCWVGWYAVWSGSSGDCNGSLSHPGSEGWTDGSGANAGGISGCTTGASPMARSASRVTKSGIR